MPASVPPALLLTGLAIAALHAAIPTHWLPFVLVGRGRGWTRRRTLTAVALAGGGHVLVTTALGLGLALGAFQLAPWLHEAFHGFTAALLIALGLWLILRPACHACGHPHSADDAHRVPAPCRSDRAAFVGLFLTLTLSPCQIFLPVYLTAVPYGWSAVLLLGLVLAATTLGGMVLLTALTLAGFERWTLRRHRWQSPRLVGGCLCLLGFATLALSHH